jgi:hypothetical protein
LLIENLVLRGFSISNQQSKIINQQLLRVCEEARDCRHGESSLPPAAEYLEIKKENHNASCKTRKQTPRQTQKDT